MALLDLEVLLSAQVAHHEGEIVRDASDAVAILSELKGVHLVLVMAMVLDFFFRGRVPDNDMSYRVTVGHL